MQSYREIYKGKCLPKHHFLEAHCADFINEWGFGMAKLGESGIELAHQTMAHAEKCARHLGKTERGAQAVLNRHYLSGSPQIIAALPVKKECKKRKSNPKPYFNRD